MRILALEPQRRFTFTWSAPRDHEYVRAQRTIVTLELEPTGNNRTRLRFTHSGWGSGEDWDRAYDYFDVARNHMVLPRLRHRFSVGPINWKARPDLKPVASSLKTGLALHSADSRTAGGR